MKHPEMVPHGIPRLSPVLIICFWLAACSGAAGSSRYQKQAEQFVAEGHLAEAVLTYQQALISDPDNPDLLQGLGSALAAQGRGRSARVALEQAAALLPEDAALQASLAQLVSLPQDGNSLKLVWLYHDVHAEPVGAAAAAGRVFVAYTDGHLLALDQGSGRVLWEIVAGSPLTSRPAADAGQAWVGAEDGSVFEFDSASGQGLGVFPTGAAVFAAPVLTPKMAFIASNDGILYALERSTLDLAWKAQIGEALHASPLAGGQSVFIGSLDGRMYGFDMISGERLWPYGIPTQGAVESTPILAGERIFFGSGDGRVYALDAETGGEYWRFSTPDSVYASPLVWDDRLIVASSGQVLASIGIQDGLASWSTRFEQPLTEQPVLFKGRLYLVTRSDPRLISVDPKDGAIQEELNTGDWITQGPLVAGDDMVFVGKDGAVFLYR